MIDAITNRFKVALDSKLHGADYSGIELVLEPTVDRGIYVTANKIAKGELRLAPVSLGIMSTAGKVPDQAVDLDMSYHISAAKGAKKTQVKFYIVPKPPQKQQDAKMSGTSCKDVQEFIIPFWLLSVCGDSAKANCVIEFETVEVMGQSVEIPMCKNTKQLKHGDRVYVYQPHGVTSKFPIFSLVSASSAAKRQKKAD